MLKRFVVLLIAILALGTSFISAQEAGDTIKISTRLVSVPVIVSDRNGRYVPNLTQGSFTVLQDGIPQKIAFFAATEEPLTIALLIDTSQSTRPVLGDIKDSAKSFIKLLGPQDRAMIVSFDYDTHILTPLTSDRERLKKGINSAEIPDRLAGTTLRDAAYQTANQSFAGIKGRKAIILLTDGKDAGSRVAGRELLYSLQETDTLIYTIMFKTGERPARNQFSFPRGRMGGRRNGDIFGGRRGGRFPGGGFPPIRNRRDNPQRTERVELKNTEAEEFLQKLSDATAGRFYSSKDGKLKKTFEMIVEELRFQYRLGFYPPEDASEGTLHELKVKADRMDAVIRSRRSYRTQSKN